MEASRRSGVGRWLLVAVVLLATGTFVYLNPFAADRDAPAAPPQVAPATHDPASHAGGGLSDNQDGYLLSPVALPDRRGDGLPVAFQIIGPDRTPVTTYESVLSERLHLYVLREDLSFYQHLHPTLARDTWTTAVDVPDGGVYRLYTEFTALARTGSRHSLLLSATFIIAGDTRYVPVPAPAAEVRVGKFVVARLDGTADAAAGRPDVLRFQVRDTRGAPVTALEPYLGTYAHVSAFETTTQSLLHLHPTMPSGVVSAPGDGVLTFHAQFPQRGRHRLFLQFKAAGEVRQAAFTVIAR